MAAGKLKVQITLVPVQGKTTTKTVQVAKSGVKLSAVLKAAGISPDKRDILVNGQPASLDSCVEDGDKVSAREVKVLVSERPQGS